MLVEGATEIVAVTSASFDTIVQRADGIVLVDFWAEWCPSCKMLGPVVDEIAREYADKLTVAAIDVDQCPELAQECAVASVPTLLVIRNGEIQKRLVGAQTKAALIAELSEVL